MWTAIAAAIGLGAFNLLVAGLILLVAGRNGAAGPKHEVATALHMSAIETLQLQLQLQARAFDAARFPAHGFETLLPSLVAPAIGLLVKSLHRKNASSRT